MPKKPRSSRSKSKPGGEAGEPNTLRIIGGHFRGSKLVYHGDPRTRPMKDRVREAVFNLLGDLTKEKHAIDLFGGTGALGLEAVSRGCLTATFIERHFPTAKLIEQNAAAIGAAKQCRVLPGSAFVWGRRPDVPTDAPWVIFCSPPYAFYTERRDEMLKLIGDLMAVAPESSCVVVEADDDFDFADLPKPEWWDVRAYLPAVIGIYGRFIPLSAANIDTID